MQLDGHYSLTYVLARCAGFKPDKAETVAYSSQYVDDAIDSDDICFTNGARSRVECSAHGNYDFFSHLRGAENHRTWLPFHFLPGNGGLPAGKNPNGSFINKIVTKPDSYIADELIESCFRDKNKEYSLHRLGVTLHTIADTYTHQNFAGVVHKVNTVKNLRIISGGKLSKFEEYKSKLLSRFFPLGHSAALSLPDIPFIHYCYEDYEGTEHLVDNIKRYEYIVKAMYDILLRYRRYGIDLGDNGDMKESDFKAIIKNLISFDSFDEKERANAWRKSIAIGYFSFGYDVLFPDYDKEKWKFEALGDKVQTSILSQEEYVYSDYFLKSDYRLFHSAIKAHRFALANDILPRYGICIN